MQGTQLLIKGFRKSIALYLVIFFSLPGAAFSQCISELCDCHEEHIAHGQSGGEDDSGDMDCHNQKTSHSTSNDTKKNSKKILGDRPYFACDNCQSDFEGLRTNISLPSVDLRIEAFSNYAFIAQTPELNSLYKSVSKDLDTPPPRLV